MISTTAIPRTDLPVPPHPTGGEPAGAPRVVPRESFKEWPTHRVSVASLQPPSLPALTPAPPSDLLLSYSVWSDEDPGPRRGSIPRVGDTILGFKLVGELGRGAFARVFLAHQESLSNRPVALKVTLKPTKEAERLARLQHTNIVPVYSVHNDPPVQLICMPYLGRTTIADLIRAYRTDHSTRHTGGRKTSGTRAGKTTTIESGSAPKSDGRPGTSRVPTWTWESEEAPPIVCDPLAVVQVLAQLAAGLSHAHERGILHLDLKPANVLLADTGEPMLLDFNLSYDTTRAERDLVGGTIPYMAIEQLLDLRHRGRGVIDARTDLYSLGVMAFEMLTATVPFPASSKEMRDVDGLIAARKLGPPSIRELNPAVSPAIEAIIHKLLAPEPGDRYQSAEELRIDAERHLAHLPLMYARERSVRERFVKWRRRNPGTLARMLGACVIGLALGLGGVAHMKAEAVARSEAVERAQLTRGALDTVRLDLILPDDQAARARGIKRANELLAAYGLPDDPNWQKRPELRRLSQAERATLAGDLGELLLLLAHTRGQEDATRSEADRRSLVIESLNLNRAAATCFSANDAPPLLEQQAVALTALAGDTREVAALTADERRLTVRDRFLEAAVAITQGRYQTAEPLLKSVVAEQPNHAAAQCCLAFSRQQLGKYTEALDRYDTVQALLPNDPRPAYQRGLIYTIQQKYKDAEPEFTRAIQLDPKRGDVYRNRALARYRLAMTHPNYQGEKAAEAKQAKLKDAEADLTLALELGSPAFQVRTLRAYVRDTLTDTEGATADRDATKSIALTTEGDYLMRGWTRMKDDPKGALKDFQEAEKLHPRSLIALQNQAHVLADLMKEPAAALPVVSRVVEFYPDSAAARAGRAIVLARLGKRDEAHEEIEKARQLSSDAQITYQTAAVYALTSLKHPDDKAKALALLRQSLREGYYNVQGIATDSDFDPVRKELEFEQIRHAAATLSK